MKPRTIQGILLGVVIGIAVGIGAYTFAYAKGWSYLTDNPAACANCHVMQRTIRRLAQVIAPRGGDLQ